MRDRATYLARTIISRVRSLEGVLTEDGIQAEPVREQRRTELLQKILAIEEGFTSGAAVKILTTALPRISASQHVSDRDFEEFVAVIRREVRQT